ncbi:MAG: AhpC/TSA family protein [Chitinophagaceae bacterium]|nr:AhpC/TSA family protein [Chitinophagaceae bacterium]
MIKINFILCAAVSTFLILSVQLYSQKAPEGLFIGSRAPDFKAFDQNKNEIRLKNLIRKGNVVLFFYQGSWCVPCNRILKALKDTLTWIQEKGASVVAITPELPDKFSKIIDSFKITFPVLHDEDLKMMRAYDVANELTENVYVRLKNSNINLEKHNGKNARYLPVTSLFVIDKEWTVKYRFFEKDNRKRPVLKEVLDSL